MSFSPNFSASQSLGSPSQITITDTSTGTDASIASRRVYLRKKDGSFLVPSSTSTEYIAWALPDTSIAIDALDKDYALLITVQWLDVANTVLYDKTSLWGFTLYNETFDYYLTQMLSANTTLINDNDFWRNKGTLRTYIDAGDQAVSLATDQFAAQICYDAATDLRTNSQYYYNSNA